MSEPQNASRFPRMSERKPGECLPWADKMKDLPEITGDEAILERVWQDNDALAYAYIWHLLVSF